MRVAIDVLGAPASSGGMRAYAEEVVRTWAEEHPDDELLVIGNPWVAELGLTSVRTVVQPEGAIRRVLGMWVGSGLRARAWRADALVSVSQVVSPLMPAARRVCVVHDWRHLLKPAEFGRAQRLYRRSWLWSVRRAGTAVTISDKTRVETARFAPEARETCLPNGRDHARRWPSTSAPLEGRYVVTFGHLPNKRPELALDALADAIMPDDVRLVVLGARDEYAAQLAARARRLGVADRVVLPGFVDTAAYRALVSHAAAVALCSTDEGFGLPVAEANWFGVPCVSTRDSGLGEIHPGRVALCEPDPADLAVTLAKVLTDVHHRLTPAGDETWAAVVRGLRQRCLTGST